MKIKKEAKRVLYNTQINDDDLEYAKENLEVNETEVTDDNLWEEAYSMKNMEFDDLRINLRSLSTKGNIIAIADAGYYNGRRTGYKILDTSIDSIFDLLQPYDDVEIYLDEKDLRITGYHHDGTDYILLRSFKQNITEEQENNFTSLMFTPEGVNNYQIGYYTESIRPLIADYYGF